MKKLSKILAVLVVFTMLCGMVTITHAAQFSDVNSENKHYDSITILSAFGIINGYEDGTFGPEKDVTRAEFATMLMRAMASAGIGSTDAAGTPFTDIEGHWGISDIRTAYDLGIINGMTPTTFEPNSNVTYEQALKMIVCALNYGGQAEAIYETTKASNPNLPWYYGYMQTARNLGLTDNVSVVNGQPAKRAQIAQMIFNALDVNMLEKVEIIGSPEPMYVESTQNWLKDKLKITKSRGDLLADESNTMDEAGSFARPGYAMFSDDINGGTVTILKNGISLDGLLGKYVEYYYKTDIDGSKRLVLAYSKSGSNTSVKVDAINLYKISGSYNDGFSVKYYENETSNKTLELKVSAKPIISFNGEVRTDITPADLNIETGTLEFISNGGNYNKINVESYETYVVKSVNKTDKYIVDMYRPSGSNTLYIDDEDSAFVINMKNASGSTVSISNVSQYNVLTVKRGKGTANRTTLDITVSNKNVSGTIKELDTEYVNINGTEYGISTYLDKYGSDALDVLSTGDSCKAYLDKDGKIAYITKTASSSSYFGYIATASISSDDIVRLALISKKTPSMGSPYVNVAKKVKIDGISYSDSEEIIELLEESAGADNTNVDGNGNRYSQLVKYTINAAGEITEIDTAVISEKEDPADETTFQAFEVARKAENMMQYKSSSYDFIGASNTDKFRINSSTEVFLVPLDRGDHDAYGRKSSSFFKDGSKYIVEAYNVTGGLNIAEAVVVYETEATEAVVEYNTPIFIISSISQKPNADGEDSDLVKGFQVTSSGSVSEKEYYTSEVDVIAGEYSIGDVIIFVTDNKGYIKEDSIILALDADDFEADHIKIKEGSSTHYTELHKGLLVGADLDGTTQAFDLALVDDVEDCADTDDIYSGRASSSVKFFVYDPAASGSKKITQQDSFDLTSLASFNETVETGSPEAAQLFVYSYYGSVRAVVVVKK
ncbi:MAG: S-layer homology domain-containing protein [Clostridia bacterium]|nr:S-layer homology domain-containing protein [Clostridia bacterium]